MRRKNFAVFQSAELKNVVSKLVVSAMISMSFLRLPEGRKDPLGMAVKSIN